MKVVEQSAWRINTGLAPFQAIKTVCAAGCIYYLRKRISSSEKMEWNICTELIKGVSNFRHSLSSLQKTISQFAFGNCDRQRGKVTRNLSTRFN